MSAVFEMSLGQIRNMTEPDLDEVMAIETDADLVVVSDIRMPGMDGLEATRRLRAGEQGGSRRVPVVALTADVTVETGRACLAAGMDDYVPKPIQPEELDGVEAVGAQIVDEAGILGHLFGFDAQMLDDDFLHAIFDVAHILSSQFPGAMPA